MKYRVVVLTAVCMLSNVYAAQPAASASMQKKLNSIWAGPQQTQERSAAGRWVKNPNMTLKYGFKGIALNNAKNIWAISFLGIYKFEENAWKKKGNVSNEPLYISIATDDTPYVVLPTYPKRDIKLIRFDGTSWTQVQRLKEWIFSLSVVNADDIWIVKQVNDLPFHWNGKVWAQKGSERLKTIRVGRDGVVMGLSMSSEGEEEAKSLVQWDGKKWQKLYTFKNMGSELAVLDKDTLWIANSVGSDFFLYKWDPKNKQWIKQGKMLGFDLVVGRDGSLWSSDRDNVYQWVENGVKCETGGTCTAQPPLKAVLPETINVRPSQPRKTNGGAQKTPPFIPSQTN
ncbi:MAG: hypothetical protein ACD_64C00170G0004 [uncultured bacterium]|nr:MAG: hypothetical protein ACD_64C00170G0004 [uncultured bacterium]